RARPRRDEPHARRPAARDGAARFSGRARRGVAPARAELREGVLRESADEARAHGAHRRRAAPDEHVARRGEITIGIAAAATRQIAPPARAGFTALAAGGELGGDALGLVPHAG